ncbi:vitamin B12 ABC transporter substrate-binding protein BtuF [Photobacterium leiognathi subsp. mandapamensis]|nr:vitamin B12 ABC transporter substrate-binding protein BtuF [Photobacterium leiognathi subsp. mandapamensis]
MRLLLFIVVLFPFSSTFAEQSQSVQRIISLSPHMTELAYSAGLGDKLIAASDYSDYPEQAKKLERVANYRGIKMERILALKPDLILAWKGGNPNREMTRLQQLGIKIFYSNPTQLTDIAETILKLGQFSDDPSIAQAAAKQFKQQLVQIKEQYQNKSKVRYFYQLSDNPILTLSDGNWPSPVFSVCGGENIFATSTAAYPQVNQEQVVVRQPDVIFGSSHATAKENSPWLNWPGELPAVDNHHLYQLNSDWLNRPTLRTLKAIKQVCQLLDKARKH